MAPIDDVRLREHNNGVAVDLTFDEARRRFPGIYGRPWEPDFRPFAGAETGREFYDRVAGFLPNLPEAVIAMLATASLGAIWSSCSSDYGVQGALDRFSQIEPVVLFVVDGYWSGGKVVDTMPRACAIVDRLRSLGLHPSPLPLGLIRPGESGGCILCNTCNSFPCRVHAKSDAEICAVRPATARPTSSPSQRLERQTTSVVMRPHVQIVRPQEDRPFAFFSASLLVF